MVLWNYEEIIEEIIPMGNMEKESSLEILIRIFF